MGVLEDPPPERPELRMYWDAFHDLSTCRQIGMASGPIPWTALNEYALRYGIVGDGFDRFCRLIRAMDDVVREKWSPKKEPTAGD